MLRHKFFYSGVRIPTGSVAMFFNYSTAASYQYSFASEIYANSTALPGTIGSNSVGAMAIEPRMLIGKLGPSSQTAIYNFASKSMTTGPALGRFNGSQCGSNATTGVMAMDQLSPYVTSIYTWAAGTFAAGPGIPFAGTTALSPSRTATGMALGNSSQLWLPKYNSTTAIGKYTYASNTAVLAGSTLANSQGQGSSTSTAAFGLLTSNAATREVQKLMFASDTTTSATTLPIPAGFSSINYAGAGAAGNATQGVFNTTDGSTNARAVKYDYASDTVVVGAVSPNTFVTMATGTNGITGVNV